MRSAECSNSYAHDPLNALHGTIPLLIYQQFYWHMKRTHMLEEICHVWMNIIIHMYEYLSFVAWQIPMDILYGHIIYYICNFDL